MPSRTRYRCGLLPWRSQSNGASYSLSEEDGSAATLPPTDHGASRRQIYFILIVITLIFLVLNIFQIAFIYELNTFYWTAVFPAVLFAACLLFLGYELYRKWPSITKVKENPQCSISFQYHAHRSTTLTAVQGLFGHSDLASW